MARLERDIFYLHTQFGDSCFSYSGDMIVGVGTQNGLCNPDHAPFKCDLSSIMLGLHIAYPYTNFDKLNLIGLCDFTTPLGWFANRGLALATANLTTIFEVSNSTHYEDMKGDTKC